jgi:hypothetical protein
VWYANGGQAEAAVAGLRNVVLMAPDGPRRLLLTACYSGPISRHQQQRQQQQQQQQQGMHHGSGSPYASGSHLAPGSSGGMMDASRGSAAAALMQQQLAYQQQAQVQAQMVQQLGMQQLQQQQGVAMLAPGQDPPGVMQVWNNQAPPGTSAPVSAAAAITMQLAGAHMAQRTSSGGFDMQQLAFALPQQAGAVSAPMVQQAGQIWQHPGGSPQMLVAQVPAGLGQSGNMLEQLGQLASDGSSVPGGYMGSNPAAPGVSAGIPAGMGYTGWLY